MSTRYSGITTIRHVLTLGTSYLCFRAPIDREAQFVELASVLQNDKCRKLGKQHYELQTSAIREHSEVWDGI